jgi:hypothetical protein
LQLFKVVAKNDLAVSNQARAKHVGAKNSNFPTVSITTRLSPNNQNMSVGSILGYLDRFYFAIDRLHLCKQRPLFFSDGFGNPEKLEHCEHVVAEFFEKSIRDQRPISAPPLSDTPDSIVWEPYSDCNQSSNLHCRSERRKSHSEFIHRLGSFQSPFSDQLPASSQRASFLLVAPRDVSGPWREKYNFCAVSFSFL